MIEDRGWFRSDKDMHGVRRYASLKMRTPQSSRTSLPSSPALRQSKSPPLPTSLPSFLRSQQLQSCEVISDVCTRNPINQRTNSPAARTAAMTTTNTSRHYAAAGAISPSSPLSLLALYLLTETVSWSCKYHPPI